MAKHHLKDVLRSIDWKANVTAFCDQTSLIKEFEEKNKRIAIWSRQLEQVDRGNPTLSFVREMQAAGHSVPALTGLALYKPAAAAMRATLETAMYYTYFRTHLVELGTLVRDREFYMSKKEVLDFHSKHTRDFTSMQSKLGLITQLNNWYRTISAVIHGQIPGDWTVHNGLLETNHKDGMIGKVSQAFGECEEIIHKLFLITVAQEMWNDFSINAKRTLLKGISGDVKSVLGLVAT